MYKIKCKNCGNYFIAKNKRAETCSQSCRTAFHYRKKFGDKVLNIENTSISVEQDENTLKKYNVFKGENTFKKYNENRYIIIETVERFNSRSKYKYYLKRINKNILLDISAKGQNILYQSLPDNFVDNGESYDKVGYFPRKYYNYWENFKEVAVHGHFFCAAMHSKIGEIYVLYLTEVAFNKVLSKNAKYFTELLDFKENIF